MRIANDAVPLQPRLYCYDDTAKHAHSQNVRKFYRQASKLLPGFTFKVHFNKGGIAVWGEITAKIYHEHSLVSVPNPFPVVEAYDTPNGMLVRQWDGRNSGHNHYVQTLNQFVSLVKELASKPFVRF